jgi:hypothetical protein
MSGVLAGSRRGKKLRVLRELAPYVTAARDWRPSQAISDRQLRRRIRQLYCVSLNSTVHLELGLERFSYRERDAIKNANSASGAIFDQIVTIEIRANQRPEPRFGSRHAASVQRRTD